MLKARMCCLINWIRINIFKSQIPNVVLCKEFPECPEENYIYITYEEKAMCYLLMKCPCGCGADIDLSLLKGLKPRWTIEFNIQGTISIKPSIWRKHGCKSHFFYKSGKVLWCRE